MPLQLMKSWDINLEDVLGLGRIFDMLGYLCIYDGDYEVTYSEFDGDNLILKLKLPCTLPQEFPMETPTSI